MRHKDAWFIPLYAGLHPVILCMARRYAGTWGVEADDLVQVAGLALWTCCSRYSTLPPDQQLRIGNTVARRTMLRWCDQEGRTPTHLGTAGSVPWFAGRSTCAESAPAEDS